VVGIPHPTGMGLAGIPHPTGMGLVGIPHPTGMGLVGAVDTQPGAGVAAAVQTGAAVAVDPAGVAAAAQTAVAVDSAGVEAGVEPAAWLARSAFADGAASSLGRSSSAVRWDPAGRRTSPVGRVSSRADPPGSLNWTVGGSTAWWVSDISDVLPLIQITVYQTGPEGSLPAARAAITLCWRGQ
jgi:hypothetical protein